MHIQGAEARREPLECSVGDPADRPERMVLRDALLQRYVTEHRSRLLVGSTHLSAPFVSGSMVVQSDRHVALTFSAAC
jgi:hypothetical protein